MKLETRMKKQQEIDEKIEKWVMTHNGAFPRRYIRKNSKNLSSEELSQEESEEVSLAMKWEKYHGKEKTKKLRSDGRKISRMISWFKKNRGKLPKRSRTAIDEDERKIEDSAYITSMDPIFEEIHTKYDNTPLDEIPVEYREYMELYREVPQENKHFEMIIKWLDEHNGEMPRDSIYKNGQKISRGQMTKEEYEEVRIEDKWNSSKAKKILEQYSETEAEKIPSKYRKYILKIREYGYGISGNLLFKEIINWLDENQDRLPRVQIEYKGRELTKKEVFEMNLRKKWNDSIFNSVLKEYEGKKIEEVPEEYREKIKILREHGLGLTEKDLEDKIFEWLSNHDGKMPRDAIKENGTIISRTKLPLEEYREVQLYKRWLNSNIRKVLLEYVGKPIEEVPEEFRERISILRNYGYGREKIEVEDVFEEIIKWLKEHNGAFPKTSIIYKKSEDPQRRVKHRAQMSKEERYELFLSNRWLRTEEYKIFKEYQDKEIEEIPEEFREKIALLRKFHIPVTEKYEAVAEKTFEEYIEWLDTHGNKTPRRDICSKGKRISSTKLSEEELYETRLYTRFQKSKVKRILDEYVERPIEEVPEQYREKIRILREHGIVGKSKSQKAEERMKKAVAKNVGENESTRNEIEAIFRTKED